MKILFLTNIPSPYRVKFFQELGNHVDLTVLYEKQLASNRDEKWVYQIDECKSYKEIVLKAAIRRQDTAFCPSVVKYLKQATYDFIIVGVYSTATALYAIRYMKRKKIPYWISCDGALVKNENSLKRFVKKQFLVGADGYFSSGAMTDQWLMHYGVSEEKIYRYPFSSIYDKQVEKAIIDEGSREELKKKLGFSYPYNILFVGQFIHRKGVDTLLDAVERLPRDIGVYLVGGEPQEEYLQKVREGKLTNVIFLPFMQESCLKEYYKAADLFVLPTREDIWGLVINEALGNGVEVITTDKCVAGMEMIQDGVNGRIVPADDSESLTKAILEELHLPKEEKERRREEALKVAAQYTIERMVESHLKAWESIKL